MSHLFSIGVTTFDREEMLKETLDSISAQSFQDYEVIVSNDNPNRKISGESLGISDPRFKFINQTSNLGELSNMNYLLRESTGKYFTWISDDDLYAPDFLESVYKSLLKYSFPKCVFTSFNIFGNKMPKFYRNTRPGPDGFFDGPVFFYRHSKGRAKTISTMGVFDRDILISMGGLEDISEDGKGMFCEYMLLVKTIMLDKIAYINKPLVSFRFHEGSWGCMSTDIDMYRRATDNLIKRSTEIFKKEEFKKYFYSYFHFMLNLAILNNIVILSRRSSMGDRSFRKVAGCLLGARKHLQPLRRSRLYLKGLLAFLHAEIGIISYLACCLARKIVFGGWEKCR